MYNKIPLIQERRLFVSAASYTLFLSPGVTVGFNLDSLCVKSMHNFCKVNYNYKKKQPLDSVEGCFREWS